MMQLCRKLFAVTKGNTAFLSMVSDGQLIPAVVVKQTVLLSGVLAEPTTYPALIFASEAVSVRMMRTQNKHDTDDDGDFDDL